LVIGIHGFSSRHRDGGELPWRLSLNLDLLRFLCWQLGQLGVRKSFGFERKRVPDIPFHTDRLMRPKSANEAVTLRSYKSSFGGRPLLAGRPLPVIISIVHCEVAGEDGLTIDLVG
jgi:hypothetical protein